MGREMNPPEVNPLTHLLTNLEGDSSYIGSGSESSRDESSDSSPDQFQKKIPSTLGQEMNPPEKSPLTHLLTNLERDSLYIGSGNGSSRDESSDSSPDQFTRRFHLHWVRK